jgi:hypothetical protein
VKKDTNVLDEISDSLSDAVIMVAVSKLKR